MFTSPQEGTYVFYVSALEYKTQYLKKDIVMNSGSKVRAVSDSSASYQTATNMVVLNLQKGDRVRVRHFFGKSYTSANIPETTFSVFLIL